MKDYPTMMENPPQKARAGQTFIFRRSPMDKIWREHCPNAEDGTLVRVIQMHSAPKPGTMGQVHIEDAGTGEFLGMCSMSSLTTRKEEMEYHKPPLRNPPLNAAEDVKNRRLVGFLMRLPKVKAAEAGRMGTGEFFYEVEMRDGKVFRHKYATQAELIAGVGMFVKGIERENPPVVILKDTENDEEWEGRRIIHYRITESMKDASQVAKILETWFPQWKVVRNYSLKAGTYPQWKHTYGAEMTLRSKKNPPLPASALIDVATAKTVAHEVEEGQRPLGNLGTVDHLLDRGLQKLRGSHLGQVDWQNPGPGRIKHYTKRTQPLSRHNVVKAIEQLIEANVEVGELLARFKRRGMVSDDEYLEWKYVQQIAMMLRDDLTLATGSEMTNPPAKEIYRDIVEIRAIKPDGKRYVHKFGKGSGVYGLPDGSVLIASRKGKRLWKNFKVGG